MIAPHRFVHAGLRKYVFVLNRRFLAEADNPCIRLSVVMTSRLMINLRDPSLHRPDDSDEGDYDSLPNAGYVSTVVLELDTFSSTVGTSSGSDDLTLFGLLYSTDLTHVKLTESLGDEPCDLERMRRNALKSIQHKALSNLQSPHLTPRRASYDKWVHASS